MNESKSISIAVIKRLPRYYRYLGDLLDANITRISSMELSQKMNVTASQIRQDFNNFGCFGQQGYGYNVEFLYHEIQKILGLDRKYAMIIIGSGNIGQALAKYKNFPKRGFYIEGMFDNAQDLIGKTFGANTVLDIRQLEQFIQERPIDVAILALPQKSIDKVSEIVIRGGIKGIWNFSSMDIEVPEGVNVENVHLTDSLMTLSYKINEYTKKN